MPGLRDFGNIWTTFKELDLRPIREEAERPVVLGFVGAKGVGKSTLIGALRHGARPHEKVVTPAFELDLAEANQLPDADLAVLVLDATRSDFTAEANVYRRSKEVGRPVLVFYNKMDAVKGTDATGLFTNSWDAGRVAYGSALDPESLETQFVPRVLEALPNRLLSLGRHYPVFRFAVARHLIGDTSLSNATFALGTGLAEVVPVLNIPLNATDMLVLTKNQAIMVYKLGLVLGLPPRWQDHWRQLGGVVGAGFVWRQVARELVGLIPVWGILPKTAIAYAGTYAAGEAVLYWYRTGHKINSSGMRQLYKDALARGREVAQGLIARTPRPAAKRGAQKSLPAPAARQICAYCGRENPSDAQYCAFCGKPVPAQIPTARKPS